MTFPRIVALAQALAMITILVPGPHAGGPGSASAAVVRDRASERLEPVLMAQGSGVGCEAGTKRFKGPRPPGAPPWPPGAEPTPTPSPSPEPLASGASDPSSSPEAARGSIVASDTSEAPMVFLAGTAMGMVQAEATPSSSAEPSPSAGSSPEPSGPSGPELDALLEPPTDPLISGIDVSHHNGDVDFQRIREAGYRFAYLKATQDNDFIDPMFATNLSRARQAGLAAGGYHFFDYTLDGRAQADHFLDRLEAVGGLDDVLPPVVDVECWSPVGPSIHALSAARLRDFVERVYERIGRTPVVYTSVLMWREVVGEADGFGDLTLWAACWDCESPPSIATGWDRWTFWQTGIDRIRGVGSLDGNLFSGTPEDLAAMQLRPLTIEGGAPATSRQQVELDLGGRDATHLRTSTDGEAWTRWSPIRGTPRALLAGREEGVQELHVQLRKGSSLKSPVFSDSIAVDLTGPSASEPTVGLALGALVDDTRIPVRVSWEAGDDVAGMGDARVAIACGEERPDHVEVSVIAPPGVTTSASATAALPPGAPCALTVTSRDTAGNATRVHGPPVEVLVTPPASTDGQLAVTVEAAQVGIVARRGPGLGSLTVLLDGEPVELVDLSATEVGGREVVSVLDLEPGAPRNVSVEVTPERADASGPPPSIDGFVTLTAR